MPKREVLQATGFGATVAEDEARELSGYFVETEHWRRILAGEVDVVYGPKGSGKSALYSLLLERAQLLLQRAIVVASAENPRGAPAFRDLAIDPPATEREFVSLWKLYFLSIMSDILVERVGGSREARTVLASLREAGLVGPDRSLSSILRAVRDYARRFTPESVAGEIRLDPATGLPTGIGGKITLREPTAREVDRGAVSVDRLFELADQSLSGAGLAVWILLDRLDVAFAETPDLEENALRALFKVYLDLLPRDHLRLKIFLRSDIWARLTAQGFREASHITRQLTIKWDSPSLLNLVVRRALQNDAVRRFYAVEPDLILRSGAQQNQFFYRLFPGQVDVGPNKPRTFDWIVGRTRDGTRETAPRELIHLLNSARDVQLRRYELGDPEPEGELLFSRGSLKEALPSVSRQKLEQTLFAEYPFLRDRILQLRGQRTRHHVASLARVWQLPTPAAVELARELVRVGFFEEQGSRDRPEFWVPFLFRDALDMIQGTAR